MEGTEEHGEKIIIIIIINNNNKINQSRREGATGRPKTKRKILTQGQGEAGSWEPVPSGQRQRGKARRGRGWGQHELLGRPGLL